MMERKGEYNMNIRNVNESDYETIQQLDFMTGLRMQWDSAYHKEDEFVSVNDEGEIIGAASLFWDGTWYYLNKKDMNLPLYRMQIDVATSKDAPKNTRRELIRTLQEHFKKYTVEYPNRKLCMRCWCVESDKDYMQELLEEGFYVGGVIMVFKYDTTRDFEIRKSKENICVEELNNDDESIKAYLVANEAGYGTQDSEDEFRFMMMGEDTKVFVAKVDGKIVSSTSIWKIEDGRWATENVFTIPEYRRKGIGREVLYTALKSIQEQKGEVATLTVVGDNKDAIAMYLSMGYSLMENMMEMHYILD